MLPQKPAPQQPTEAQRKCDEKLKEIFGAIAAGSGFEPPNMPGKENQFRGGPNGHLSNAMHLYGSEDGYGEGPPNIPAGGRYIGRNPYSNEDSYMFGDLGGEGGRSRYNPNSPFNQGPYIHGHYAIHQGRGYTGKRLSFFDVFCK